MLSDGEREPLDADPTIGARARGIGGGAIRRRWASKAIWRLSIVLMLLIAVADTVLGSRVILMGLLMVGPCCALFSARRVSTAQAGGIAVGLALLLALPDGIWGTTTQFAFAGAVLMVAIACTWAAGIVEAAVGPEPAEAS
jgi:hypothetical protein